MLLFKCQIPIGIDLSTIGVYIYWSRLGTGDKNCFPIEVICSLPMIGRIMS